MLNSRWINHTYLVEWFGIIATLTDVTVLQIITFRCTGNFKLLELGGVIESHHRAFLVQYFVGACSIYGVSGCTLANLTSRAVFLMTHLLQIRYDESGTSSSCSNHQPLQRMKLCNPLYLSSFPVFWVLFFPVFWVLLVEEMRLSRTSLSHCVAEAA